MLVERVLIDALDLRGIEVIETLEEIERQAIFQALREHTSNRTETARALGISRRALIYKLQRFREKGFDVDRLEPA